MKLFLSLFLTILFLNGIAQSSSDRIATLPVGSTLTLKADYIIQPFEGTITIEGKDDTYGVFNLVFASKDTRRKLKAGTQFTYDGIEVLPNGVKLRVKDKINYIYFGEVPNRDNLKISALEKVFDVAFPSIEDF
jgi:hypothetical protein